MSHAKLALVAVLAITISGCAGGVQNFANVDADGDGLVSRQEFEAERGSAPRTFASADVNRDDALSPGEYARTIHRRPPRRNSRD